MILRLEFLEGPLSGHRMSVNQRTQVGRAKGELVVPDAKLSGSHMFFEKESDSGQWCIVDDNSRNGVWVNGLRETRAILKDGDKIQFGESVIHCLITDGALKAPSKVIEQWVEAQSKKLITHPNVKSEICPEIRLKAIQGIQYGQTWDIFYGPRKAGKQHMDICLFEEFAPEEAFEIMVKGRYAYFQTEHQGRVKINNQELKSKQFEPGDVISVGETQLLVEFDEGHGFSTEK